MPIRTWRTSTALSRGDRDAESVSGDRFPLRERHRQPAVRDGGVYGVPALAGRRAISRRQGRIVAVSGIYRQTAAQDGAERRAEVLHALSDTHAGIVRKDELQGRDRRTATAVKICGNISLVNSSLSPYRFDTAKGTVVR